MKRGGHVSRCFAAGIVVASSAACGSFGTTDAGGAEDGSVEEAAAGDAAASDASAHDLIAFVTGVGYADITGPDRSWRT